MSEMSAQIRILAVDDHVLVRQGISVLVGTEPDMTLVAEASNGREAIQQFRAHRPDIMPGAPSFRAFCLRTGGCGGQPPFLTQCNTCFRSRLTVTAHTDVPDHFLRV